MRARSVSARGVLAAVILLELIVLYLVMDQSSWSYDDNFFLVLAGREGFTWHWLTSVQFEHWDIGEHALISLQHYLFFVDYRWALGLMLGFLGGSIYLLERSLAMVIRKRWVCLAVAGWFGINVLWVRPLQWWAAGVQSFPYIFFDLLCLYSFIRYYACGQRRWIGISAAALAAALLFHEKPAFMLIYLALLRVLLMSEDLRPRAVMKTFWQERGVWISYVLVIAVWGIGYINSHAYTAHGEVGIRNYLTFFRILWLQTLVPALASVTIPASKLTDIQILFVVALQVAVIGAIVISLRHRRSAWRAWLFLAIVVLANGILNAHSREPTFGVDIANDPRYLVDFSWLIPLGVCAAFAPESVLEPRVPKNGARLSFPSQRAFVFLAISVSLIYTGASIASAVHLENIWAGPQAREWEKRVRSGIATLERSGDKPMVAENITPFEIMAEFVAPYNRLSRVLPMYVGPIQVDGPLDAPLVRLANDGTVHRAVIVPVEGNSTVPELVRSHQLVIGTGGRTLSNGHSLCVIADGTPVAVERHLSNPLNLVGGPYYMQLDYRAWHIIGLPILINSGLGYPPAQNDAIELSPKVGSSIAWLGEKVPRQVELIVPPLTTVCMSRFNIATLHNAG
jgi:hypothetical protein